MQEVWIITKSSSQCFGHGDYGSVIEVACRGAYGCDGPHPAFQSEAMARMYLASIQDNYGLEPMCFFVAANF